MKAESFRLRQTHEEVVERVCSPFKQGNHGIILQQYRVFLQTESDFFSALIAAPSPPSAHLAQHEQNQVPGFQNTEKGCFRCAKGKGWKRDKTNSPGSWWEIRWEIKERLNGTCETVVRQLPNLGNGEHLSQNWLEFTVPDKLRTQKGLKTASKIFQLCSRSISSRNEASKWLHSEDEGRNQGGWCHTGRFANTTRTQPGPSLDPAWTEPGPSLLPGMCLGLPGRAAGSEPRRKEGQQELNPAGRAAGAEPLYPGARSSPAVPPQGSPLSPPWVPPPARAMDSGHSPPHSGFQCCQVHSLHCSRGPGERGISQSRSTTSLCVRELCACRDTLLPDPEESSCLSGRGLGTPSAARPHSAHPQERG